MAICFVDMWSILKRIVSYDEVQRQGKYANRMNNSIGALEFFKYQTVSLFNSSMML